MERCVIRSSKSIPDSDFLYNSISQYLQVLVIHFPSFLISSNTLEFAFASLQIILYNFWNQEILNNVNLSLMVSFTFNVSQTYTHIINVQFRNT